MHTRGLSAKETDDPLVKMGFRRWYERQLIESHLWLATCFVCIITVAAGVELLSERKGPGEFLFNATLVIGGVALAWVSWRRYASKMVHAQSIGVQAVCTQCRHYGFRLARSEDSRWLARCTRCQHSWALEQYPAPVTRRATQSGTQRR